MSEEKQEQMVDSIGLQRAKGAKILAIIAFSLTIATIVVAIILDVTIFAEAILAFIAGCVISALAFFLLVIVFIASLILVFGFFLLEKYGFWPLRISTDLFKAILGDIAIGQEQIASFEIGRYILLAICGVILVLSIVSLCMERSTIKKGFTGNTSLTTFLSRSSVVLSILGMLVSGVLVLIL